MTTLRFRELGRVGLVGPDVPRFAVPPGGFTTMSNARCYGGAVETLCFDSARYLATSTASSALPVATGPLFWNQYQVTGTVGYGHYFVYGSSTQLYGIVSSSSRENDLRRTAAGSPVSYNGDDWRGGVFGGVMMLTNGVDPPQVQLSANFATRFQNMRWDDSAGTTWSTRTAGATTCRMLKGYKNFIFALHLTENSVQYPARIRWSHPTGANQQPDSWEDTRLDIQADYFDLDDGLGEIVDAEKLNDSLIVYTRQSTWAIDWVGGESIFNFRKLFDVGAANPNCVVSLGDRHIVLTGDDFIEHNGFSYRSLVHGNLKRAIEEAAIGTTLSLAHNFRKKEIWIISSIDNYIYSYAQSQFYGLPLVNWTNSVEYNEIYPEYTFGRKLAVIDGSLIRNVEDYSDASATHTASLVMPVVVTLEKQGVDVTKLKKIRRVTPYFECSGSAVLTLKLVARHSPNYPTGRTAQTSMTLSSSMFWHTDLIGRTFDLHITMWGLRPVRLYGVDVDYDLVGDD